MAKKKMGPDRDSTVRLLDNIRIESVWMQLTPGASCRIGLTQTSVPKAGIIPLAVKVLGRATRVGVEATYTIRPIIAL